MRIIDVNINRLDESLKVIEDFIRFHLENKPLLLHIRSIRSDFLRLKRSLPLTKIIATRQSKKDPGRKASFDSQAKKKIIETILSNLSRAKESSRIIEETLKTMDMRLSNMAKRIRFQIYDLEKEMVVHVQKSFDPYLHAIIDEKFITRASLKRTVKILAQNGATMIQLRAKEMNDRDFLLIAKTIRKAIDQPYIKFIVNNRLDIALASAADGVHVGQHDMPVPRVRKIAGEMFIVGASVHNVQEAMRAEVEGADYLGVGAVYPTQTKPSARICGLNTLRDICRKTSIPVIAIGGINDVNYRTVLRAGAAGIAVASFLYGGNLRGRMRSLTRRGK
jgi:thiamine-phosphate pyrophosphorylase